MAIVLTDIHESLTYPVQSIRKAITAEKTEPLW